MPTTHALDGPSSTPSKGETSKATTDKPPQTGKQPTTTDMDLPRTTNVTIILDKEDRQPANDLAELSLVIQTHLNEKAPRDGKAGNLAATSIKVQSSNIFGMPLRKGNQTRTLEKQTKEGRRRRRC